MSTNDSRLTETVLSHILASKRTQSSGRFFWELSRTSLAGLLDAGAKAPVSPADVGRLAGLIHDLGIKGMSYKIVNGTAFFLGISLTLLGLFWPALNRVKDVTTAGTVQSAITAAGVLTLTVYRQYKKKQIRVEDALRRTLFATEDVETKIARLIELSPSIDDVPEPATSPKPASPERLGS